MMRLYFLIFVLLLSLPARGHDQSLLVLGDSISAGYGISLDQGWVHLLEKRLDELGYRYDVKNASISGDTTRGARARLRSLLAREKPAVSIVELGGNDGLRGLSPSEMEDNFDTIVTEIKKAGSKVLLVPMRLPPNYGQLYNERFEAIYRDIADRHDINLSTFILEDIAEYPDLMQGDGIHPKAEAQKLMLDNIWDSLEPLLQRN